MRRTQLLTHTGGEKVPRASIHPSAEFSPLQYSQIIELQITFSTHWRIQLYAFANVNLMQWTCKSYFFQMVEILIHLKRAAAEEAHPWTLFDLNAEEHALCLF